MSFPLTTVELLEILQNNPTFRGLSADGQTLEVRGENKEIIHKKLRHSKQRHITLLDKWKIVKPINYDLANALFKRLRTIECRFDDGSKRYYNKMLEHTVLEGDLPYFDNCLYYCLTYDAEEEQ